MESIFYKLWNQYFIINKFVFSKIKIYVGPGLAKGWENVKYQIICLFKKINRTVGWLHLLVFNKKRQ